MELKVDGLGGLLLESSSSDAVRNYISNNYHSNTPGGWQRKQMALNTSHHYPHDRFLLDRYEPSKMKIRSSPTPLNNPQQVPVSPTEQLCEDRSDGRTWNKAPEPSPDRYQTATAMLNTAQQRQPVSPTDQFFGDHSMEGRWNRALEPSPASSFDSGELAEDYWEPDCSAPPNDAGSPTEDRLEPDWSPAMEPDPTATTANETAQERWDHWTDDEQEL